MSQKNSLCGSAIAYVYARVRSSDKRESADLIEDYFAPARLATVAQTTIAVNDDKTTASQIVSTDSAAASHVIAMGAAGSHVMAMGATVISAADQQPKVDEPTVYERRWKIEPASDDAAKFAETADFYCLVCREIVWKPVLCQACGKLCCEACASEWQKASGKKQSECAHCRSKSPLLPLTSNPAIKNMLGKLRVKCPDYAAPEVGCTWTGDYGDAEAHVAQRCPFATMRCPHCTKFVCRRDHGAHTAACPQKPVACPDCKQGPFNPGQPFNRIEIPSVPRRVPGVPTVPGEADAPIAHSILPAVPMPSCPAKYPGAAFGSRVPPCPSIARPTHSSTSTFFLSSAAPSDHPPHRHLPPPH